MTLRESSENVPCYLASNACTSLSILIFQKTPPGVIVLTVSGLLECIVWASLCPELLSQWIVMRMNPHWKPFFSCLCFIVHPQQLYSNVAQRASNLLNEFSELMKAVISDPPAVWLFWVSNYTGLMLSSPHDDNDVMRFWTSVWMERNTGIRRAALIMIPRGSVQIWIITSAQTEPLNTFQELSAVNRNADFLAWSSSFVYPSARVCVCLLTLIWDANRWWASPGDLQQTLSASLV